jgi:hypothetical protein
MLLVRLSRRLVPGLPVRIRSPLGGAPVLGQHLLRRDNSLAKGAANFPKFSLQQLFSNENLFQGATISSLKNFFALIEIVKPNIFVQR